MYQLRSNLVFSFALGTHSHQTVFAILIEKEDDVYQVSIARLTKKTNWK